MSNDDPSMDDYIMSRAWVIDARCSGADQEPFYPKRGESTRDTKEECALCHVRIECLEYAIINNEPAGIWGGKSVDDRKKIRRRMKEQGIDLPKGDSYRL